MLTFSQLIEVQDGLDTLLRIVADAGERDLTDAKELRATSNVFWNAKCYEVPEYQDTIKAIRKLEDDSYDYVDRCRPNRSSLGWEDALGIEFEDDFSDDDEAAWCELETEYVQNVYRSIYDRVKALKRAIYRDLPYREDN